ncbi:MAG: ATP-binding protein, partial [Chloroflexota bacterium]
AFYGDDDLQKQAAARQLSLHYNRPLLNIDLHRVFEVGTPLIEALRSVLRDAQLNGAIPYLIGWEVFLKEGVIHPEAQTFVLNFNGPRILAGESRWQFWRTHHTVEIRWFNFTAPSYQHRYKLWAHYLNGQEDLDNLNLKDLTGQFSLTSRQIQNAAMLAQDLAAQKNETLEYTHLFTAAREYSSPYLIKFAKKLTPRYHWKDIVLPDDQLMMLEEMVAMVRNRPVVLGEWGARQKLVSSAGITALFSGSSGTGKTMAAEVIALDLGFDLYKINLASVVSKYIGETEKNLEQVFNEAERSNGILFFDEADALFGKRSEVRDAHDRYANIEISYLLQRMEVYDGITILATNLQANLDEAFTRRIHFIIKFPFPERKERLHIWQALFPPDLPYEDDIDFDKLAKEFKLAGGNIRNAIVSAAYQAANDGGEVTTEHLHHGVMRELQKMGRLI